MSNSTVRNYLLAAKVHWPARERALLRRLQELNNTKSRYRIVDVGCGPGLLLPGLKGLNFDYLGVDTDPDIIQYCKENFENGSSVRFSDEELSTIPGALSKSDIVVLNGVVHHLNDEQLKELYEKLHRVRHLVILDHYRPLPQITFRYLVPFILQNLDRGKYVRLYNRFEVIPGFTRESSEVFPISFMGFRLWDYFCHYYKSSS